MDRIGAPGGTFRYFLSFLAQIVKKLNGGLFGGKKCLKKFHNAENLKEEAFWDFSTSILLQNCKKLKGDCRRLPPVTELEFQQQLLAKMWLLGPYPFIKSKLKLFFKLFHCLCILLPCYFKNYPKGPYWDIFLIPEPKMCLLFIYRQP